MARAYRRGSRSLKIGVAAAAMVIALPRGASAQLADILDIVQNIQNRVSTAITQAQAARAAAEEVRTQVRLGAGYMTPQLQQFIDNAITEGVAILNEESAGLADFAPGGQCADVCTAFRANLVDFLALSVDLTDAVLESSGAPVNPDLSQLVTLVQAAPPRLLYPMYRVFQEVLESDLRDRVRELIPETRFVVNLVMEAREDVCGPVVEYADRIQRWTTGATGVGVVVQVIGGLLKVIGETEFAGEVGVAGFVSGTVKSNKRKQAGEFVNTVGTVIDKASTFSSTKVRYCLVFAFHEETRTTLASMSTTLATMSATLAGLDFDLDLNNLDQPVSTRATQASVDHANTTLQQVAQDVTVLLGRGGGGGGGPVDGLPTRVDIERQLMSDVVLSVLYLPEPYGGLLSMVRDIVADTIQQHRQAGYPVGHADGYMARGNQAEMEFDYRTAYAWYQHAYRQATVGKPGKGKGRR